MSRPIAMKLMSTLFASALLLAAGCTRDNPTSAPAPGSGGVGGGPVDPNNHTPCATNADCGGGQICTTIGCCPGCHSDSDCASDSTCVAGSPNFCAPKGKSGPTAGPTIVDKTPPSVVNPNNFGPTPCAGDSNCPSGELCTAGLCQVQCTPGSCASGQSCIAGRCYVGGAVACGDAGQVLCANDAQCGSGRACKNGSCHAACATAVSCGIGEACAGGYCAASAPQVAQCTFDTDCGTAFRCINATCHALCGSDSQCGAANLCDHGVCRANNRPAG